MIDKSYGSYYIVCDICGDETPAGFDSFDEMLDYKMEEGWTSQRGEQLDLKDGWIDLCPNCK